MGRKESIANRQYTDEFKVEAVRLGQSIGGNQAAKRLGIPDFESVELDPAQPRGQVEGR